MIASDVRAALYQMAAWPVIAWLRPSLPVSLVLPDGSVELRTSRGRKSISHRVATQCFTGVVIPNEWVLFKPLSLPPMPQDELVAAIELAAQAANPFNPKDAVWAYRNGWLAVASRNQLRNYVDGLSVTQASKVGNQAAHVEVWLTWPDGQVELLRGFGEARRLAHQARWLFLNVALLAFSVLLGVGLLLMPALDLRSRFMLATTSYSQLLARAAPAVKDRESLVRATDLLSAAVQRVEQPVPVLAALDRLTTAVPDDTFLQSLQIMAAPGSPVKVSMSGLTSNAPALMKQLGSQGGFVGVKAPTATVRPLGATREAFSVEFTIEKQP